MNYSCNPLFFILAGSSLAKQVSVIHAVACPQVEVLQEEVVYATEEVERLTKVLDEQNGLLQALQEQVAQKDVTIQNLQQKVMFFHTTEQRNN